MSRCPAPWLVLIFSLSRALAQSLPATESAAVLAQLQAEAGDEYRDLQSFVCDESMQRFRSALDGTRTRPIDTVTASLSFENGAEHYSFIRQNVSARSSISELGGAWSEGEFGTLLRQTGILLRIEPLQALEHATDNGARILRFAFDTPASDSPWEFVFDGRIRRVPFHTELWVEAEGRRIVRIVRTATDVDPQQSISELQWAVDLHPVRLFGKDWQLPATARYSVRYAKLNRREWNEITFSHYRRYGSEVALRFDGP